jgi:DNA-binding transcriptional ArsR family regulator
MSDSSDALPATAVFELLADETRLGIVEALADRRRRNWRRAGLGFAELRRAVGVRDPGTFSYHLDRLTGVLVDDAGDEYVLTQTGLDVVDAVEAGRFGDRPTRREPTDEPCPECGTNLQLTYADGRLALVCETHGAQAATALPPAAVADRAPEDVLDVAALDIHHDIERAMAGVCFRCWGEMPGALHAAAPFETPVAGDPVADDRDGPLAVFECADCGTAFWLPPAAVVVREPAVVAFAHANEASLRDSLFVPTDGALSVETTVEERDPVRVAVKLEAGSNALAVTLGAGVDVVETARP